MFEVLKGEMVETNHAHEQIDITGREDGCLPSAWVRDGLVFVKTIQFLGSFRYDFQNMLVKDIAAAISISIVGVALSIAYSSLVGFLLSWATCDLSSVGL